MVAQGILYKLALPRYLNGLKEASRQRTYFQLLSPLVRHFVYVFFYGVRKRIFILYSFKARSQHARKGKVRVTGRVGASVFCPSSLFFSRFIEGHPDKR